MRTVTLVLACTLAATIHPGARGVGVAGAPLVLSSARVSLNGTSNIHAYTASTTTVRVVAVELGGSVDGDVLEQVLQPTGLKTFEVAIPVASLSSPRDGIDKNMQKALKAQEYPEIVFRLRGLEAAGGGYRGTGSLLIAGVEKDVTLNLQVQRTEAGLAVTGDTDLLMTDFGITPPKAMLGMLKTNPKIQIRIELVLEAPQT